VAKEIPPGDRTAGNGRPGDMVHEIGHKTVAEGRADGDGGETFLAQFQCRFDLETGQQGGEIGLGMESIDQRRLHWQGHAGIERSLPGDPYRFEHQVDADGEGGFAVQLQFGNLHGHRFCHRPLGRWRSGPAVDQGVVHAGGEFEFQGFAAGHAGEAGEAAPVAGAAQPDEVVPAPFTARGVEAQGQAVVETGLARQDRVFRPKQQTGLVVEVDGQGFADRRIAGRHPHRRPADGALRHLLAGRGGIGDPGPAARIGDGASGGKPARCQSAAGE
jgi:hypothetical protein